MVLGTGLISLADAGWLLLNAVLTVLQYAVLFVGVPIAQEYLGNGSLGAVLGRMFSELVMVAGALVILPQGVIRWGCNGST